MTPDFLNKVQDAMAVLNSGGFKLRGKRVAIMLEPPKETYGNTSIVKPDTYKAHTLVGVVVAHGSKVAAEDRDELPLGSSVTFNRTGVIADHIRINGVQYEFYQVHEMDTLWTWPTGLEVESCAE
jgi:hypothetical protein